MLRFMGRDTIKKSTLSCGNYWNLTYLIFIFFKIKFINQSNILTDKMFIYIFYHFYFYFYF
jgi:hypothetical protein